MKAYKIIENTMIALYAIGLLTVIVLTCVVYVPFSTADVYRQAMMTVEGLCLAGIPILISFAAFDYLTVNKDL